MSNIYWATAVSGGAAGALDAIDPTDTDGAATALVAGDACLVQEADMISVYEAYESGGASESLPDVVIPDVNPGNFWWLLVERIPQDEGMVTALLYANIEGGF